MLKLGRFHRHVGIPSDFFGVMGPMFVHAIQPILEENNMWNEDTHDAWLFLFSHITRVMTHGHMYGNITDSTTKAPPSEMTTGSSPPTSM